MIAELQTGLDTDERTFLLSLARNEADFALLGIEHLGQLPGEPLPEPCSERHSSELKRRLGRGDGRARLLAALVFLQVALPDAGKSGEIGKSGSGNRGREIGVRVGLSSLARNNATLTPILRLPQFSDSDPNSPNSPRNTACAASSPTPGA